MRAVWHRAWSAVRNATPWIYVALVSLALLTLVDVWREHGPTLLDFGAGLLIRGTLPNVVAVLALTFSFLLVRYSERAPYAPAFATRQRRDF